MRSFAYFAAFALLACAGCSAFAQETAAQVIGDMVAQGTITADQGRMLLEAIKSSATTDWGQVALSVGSSVVFALTGIRLWRGPSHKDHPALTPTKA